MVGEQGPALKLAMRLVALPEPAMRRAVVGETLGRGDPAELVAILHDLCREARRSSGPPFPEALAALAAALTEGTAIPYDRRRSLYEAAKAAGHDEVARMLFAAGPPPRDELGEPAPEQSYPRGPLGLRGRTLTLGERKSLARGSRRDVLVHLLKDADAHVIRVLLANPRLVEADVVAVASRRPTRGELLRAVFESRWIARYHVKRALVLNPYCPTDLAVALLPTLTATDLRLIAEDAQLQGAVRDQARLLLDP
jgi:hypothetical protein